MSNTSTPTRPSQGFIHPRIKTLLCPKKLRLLFLTSIIYLSLGPYSTLFGQIITVAGNGTMGFNGDNQAATSARLFNPIGVDLDAAGNIYIADMYNNRIRKVNVSTGQITTVAGNESFGYNGDNQAATDATLQNPTGVALDATGNLFIADQINHRIRKVDTSTGQITTVAGNGNQGFNGDNQAATSATLSNPIGVALDAAGNIYIADQGNNRIRKVDISTGQITTVAGDGNQGYNGDNRAATSATLFSPTGVALDAMDNIYIADRNNQRIRKVDASMGQITTVAGNGNQGFNGDNQAATDATLFSPVGVDLDATGNLYIADYSNHRIRKVDASTGQITTVAGTGSTSYNGDNQAATSATLYFPYDVALDAAGNLYIADQAHHRIRKIYFLPPTLTNLAPANATVCVDNVVTVTATIGNVSDSYSFTLTNQSSISITNTASTSAFSQTLTASQTGVQAFTLTVAANGTIITGSFTLTFATQPTNLTAQVSGVLGLANPTVTITATASDATSYSLTGPGTSTTSSTGIFPVTQAGVYQLAAYNGAEPGCVASTSVQVKTSLPAQVISYSATVSLNSSPLTLSAFCQGNRFVFTGPGGYVFSNLYRTAGQYQAMAQGITQPGAYILTVYSDDGSQVQVTITVIAPTNTLTVPSTGPGGN